MSRRTALLAPEAADTKKVHFSILPMPGNGRPKYYTIIDSALYMLRGYQREYAAHWATDVTTIANGQLVIAN